MEGSSVNVKGLIYLALNFLASVGVVFSNKLVFRYYEFTYGGLLSTLHFIVTGIGLIVCAYFGVIQIKNIGRDGIKKILLLSVVYAVSVPLCNLSVRYNSLGFYQISKTAIVPATILLTWAFYNDKLSMDMLLYVVPIISGSVITGWTDIGINAAGVFFSAGCVITSAISQQWIKVKQAELKLESTQLLLYIVPMSVVVQAAFIPVFDDISSTETGLSNYEWSMGAVFWVFMTCIMALAVNITIFLCLKEVSPVTYQIVGQVKSVSILAGSFIFFGQPLDALNVLGMVVTMLGVFYYTWLKLPKPKAPIVSTPTPHVPLGSTTERTDTMVLMETPTSASEHPRDV